MGGWLLSLRGLLGAASVAHGEALAPGVKAPGFTLLGSDGREHRLTDFVGKRGLVLAWFPKAFTSG